MGGGEGVGERKLSVCVASLQLLNYSSTVSRDGFGAGRTAINLLYCVLNECTYVRPAQHANALCFYEKIDNNTSLDVTVECTCVAWSERASVCAFKYANHTRVRDWQCLI